MGWQCVPQIKGLVRSDGMRKDGKGQAKHRANAAGIVHEAFEIKDPNDGHPIPIRKSASETYDRTRTINNRYTGFRTADDVLDALEEEAARHPVKVQVKDKETGEIVIRERALRSDAVIGIAVIYNPPCEVARNWTPEQYDKFFRDCEEVMAQIPCRKLDKKGRPVGDEKHYLFRKENVIAGAEHWDEGEPVDPPVFTGHRHDIYIPSDQNGEYHGKMIDAMFLSVMVNRMFPRLMRERGWDIDDSEVTDWDRFDSDQEYKAKRKAKIKQGGKPVNNYIADKRRKKADAQLEEAQAIAEKAAELVEAAEAATLQAEADAAEIKSNAETEAAQIREDTQTEIYQQREIAQMGMEIITAARESAQKELDELKQQTNAARKIIENADAARAETERLNQEIKTVRADIDNAVRDRNAARTEAAAAQKDRDDARAEAQRIKDIMIADGEAAGQAAAQQEWDRIVGAGRDAAKAERDRIIAEAKQEMAEWKAQIQAKTEAKAKQIIEDARRAASGLVAFVMDRFDNEPFVYHTGLFLGRTYLDVAKEIYFRQIRQERLNNHSTGTMAAAEASRNQRTQGGREVTDD